MSGYLINRLWPKQYPRKETWINLNFAFNLVRRENFCNVRDKISPKIAKFPRGIKDNVTNLETKRTAS